MNVLILCKLAKQAPSDAAETRKASIIRRGKPDNSSRTYSC
jgi:hypothetical protein